MSPGTLLVAIAVLGVVGAYLARPFRSGRQLDRAIEQWVARARAELEPARRCPQCNGPIAMGDRFCRHCGRVLDAGPDSGGAA